MSTTSRYDGLLPAAKRAWRSPFCVSDRPVLGDRATDLGHRRARAGRRIWTLVEDPLERADAGSAQRLLLERDGVDAAPRPFRGIAKRRPQIRRGLVQGRSDDLVARLRPGRRARVVPPRDWTDRLRAASEIVGAFRADIALSYVVRARAGAELVGEDAALKPVLEVLVACTTGRVGRADQVGAPCR